MKPKLQKELEQLVEAQELEAEQEALVQQEQAYSSYRVLEKKESIEDILALIKQRNEVKKNSSESEMENFKPTSNLPMYIYAGGCVGVSAAIYDLSNFPVNSNQSALLIIKLIAGFGALVGSCLLAEYKRHASTERKKFDQEKAQKLLSHQNELQTIEQKLSTYERKYRADDIVLADIPETGLSLGKIFTVVDEDFPEGSEHLTLQQYTVKGGKSYDNPTSIAVLTPSTELSLDDLRSLDKITAIAYQEGNKDSTEYGFVKVENDNFCIYTDAALKFPKRVYPLHLLDSVIKNPRILIPVKVGEE